jgi:hypothetical protein
VAGLAQIQNTAQLALEVGNSPQIIFQHYPELVRPKDVKGCWARVRAGAAHFGMQPRHANMMAEEARRWRGKLSFLAEKCHRPVGQLRASCGVVGNMGGEGRYVNFSVMVRQF